MKQRLQLSEQEINRRLWRLYEMAIEAAKRSPLYNEVFNFDRANTEFPTNENYEQFMTDYYEAIQLA